MPTRERSWAETLRRAISILTEELRDRWRRLLVYTAGVALGYAIFIFTMTSLTIGRLPNYFRWFDVAEGLVDAVTLSMPPGERYHLIAEQPIFEFGYHHPLMQTLEGVFTLTVHVALNLGVMSALIGAYCLVLGRSLRHRLQGQTVAALGVGGGGGSLGVLTAGAASVACCGGGGISVALSAIGVSSQLGSFLVEHDQVFGALGVALMLLSLWLVLRLELGQCASTGRM